MRSIGGFNNSDNLKKLKKRINFYFALKNNLYSVYFMKTFKDIIFYNK